jgi:glycerol-3-phosphate responsive antiterminator
MEVLLPSDELILQEKGISKEQIEEQLHFFETGFPFLKIVAPAVIGKGITVVDNEKGNFYINKWESYRQKEGVNIVKFVPASGAASRMFKDLYEFLESDSEAPQKSSVKEFFSQIEKFAFYEELNKACLKNEGATIAELIKNNKLKAVVENLLLEKGLNYGFLPKGLLLFHSYPDEKRTPVQEHLVEGALYAANAANDVNIHFTVSHQHKALFEKHIRETLEKYQQKFNVRYHVSFSEQKSSTDTLAVDMNNRPFRENGKLVFRPGGHGALLENLNDLFADIIFIKNIDNVVPDFFKEITVKYKKIIAGILIDVQQKCFDYLKELENNYLTEDRLKEMLRFTESTLCIYHPEANSFGADTLKKYLIRKLNRPIRVCGMVKNTGEPGGGPFLTINNDGTVSPQILESSQINLNNQEDKQKMENSTHFNPVDLVCSVKNYKGEKFDLIQYVDKKTGFISIKSKNGKELKALELPGLWNGSMSDWNTVFVEVPIETFNPVKTVNDLLRPQHQ